MNEKSNKPELTTKQQKEAHRLAVDSSLEHLKRELEGRIQRGVKEEGEEIIPELYTEALHKANSELEGLGVKYSVLSGELNHRYIDREAYDRIKNAKPNTYHNIFKWIDTDKKLKPQFGKVFKGRVLYKFIKYLEGELSNKEYNPDPHTEKIIAIAIDGQKVQTNNKKHANKYLRSYSCIKNDQPGLTISGYINKVGIAELSDITYRKWIENFNEAEQMLLNDD